MARGMGWLDYVPMREQIMQDNWGDKFKKKLQEKELANQENIKNFKIYQDATLKLFDFIEKKVKSIEAITVSRRVVGTAGPTSIKSLILKCQEKLIQFVPEGINLDSSRGRIRIHHTAKNLSKFIYLNLIIDPESTVPYPENLMWVYNITGAEDIAFKELSRFDDMQFENLIENCFLE